MTKQYILIKAFVLMAGWGTLGFSQSDTTVLNQTEFRFPETHPGEVFLVKKAILSPKGSLPKSGAVEASSSAAPFAKTSEPLLNRDLRGRLARGGGEYQKRMEQIRRKHGLPTLSASAQEPGRPFKVPKNFRMPEGSRFAVVSNSSRIRNAKDLAAMEKAERQAVRRRYGALSPEFSRQVDAMKENDSLDVVIEIAVESPGYVNGMKAPEAEKIANARAWARAKPRVSRETIRARYGLKSLLPENEKMVGSRLLVARVSKGSLRGMAYEVGIASINPYREPGIASGSGPRSFMEAVNSAYNPPGDMVNYGGRVAATFEVGLGSFYVNCADPGLRPVGYDISPFGLGGQRAHSEGMYNFLALGTPDNYRYHFNDGGAGLYFFQYLVDSLINLHVDVISTSFITQWEYETWSDSRFIDRQAYVYPYTAFALAAGNAGHQYVPISRTYNSLIVGNVQHRDNSYYTVDFNHGGSINASQSRNPVAKYGSDRDWELPTLIAPGVTPDVGWGWIDSDSCIYWNSVEQWSGNGSSISAPVAAAMATNVIGARSSYTAPLKPLEAKAILMLTAQNVDSGYWNPSSQDSRDGAGTVSGSNAVQFAMNATTPDLWPYGDPIENGLVTDYFDSAYFEQSGSLERYYRYRVPASIPTGKHLRAVLTWTSSPSPSADENEISDLGLYVNDDNGWVGSDTWNSNVEIVDIDNANLTANQDYYVWVHPSIYRKSSGGPDLFYYTVAWTWVKDHAD